jgi:hypothetical protein
VIFHTQNWGEIIEKLFQNTQNAGVIGVAGSTLVSENPAGWYNFHLLSENRFNLLQHSVNIEEGVKMLSINPNNEKLSRVLVLDGVLMFVKKSVWAKFRFDQDNFSGFHLYDLDFSARVASKYHNFVTYEILLEHLSEGNLNSNWVESVLIFKNKLKGRLPISLSGIPVAELAEEESRKIRHLLNNMIRFRVKPRLQLDYLLQLMKYDFPGSVKLGLKILANLFNVKFLHGL